MERSVVRSWKMYRSQKPTTKENGKINQLAFRQTEYWTMTQVFIRYTLVHIL